MSLPQIPAGLDPNLAEYLHRLSSALEQRQSTSVSRRNLLEAPRVSGSQAGYIPAVPPAPTNLVSVPVPVGAKIKWDPTTDPSVKCYEISRGGIILTRVVGTDYYDPEARHDTSYQYEVRAIRDDETLGESAIGTAASITFTPAGDFTAGLISGIDGSTILPGSIPQSAMDEKANTNMDGFAFVMSFQSDGSPSMALTRKITLDDVSMSYVVKSGDKLEYDWFFTENSKDTRGMVDLHSTHPAVPLLSQSGILDADGRSVLASTQLTTKGQWKHRVITLPAAWVGQTINSAALRVKGAASGLIGFKVKNIVIISAGQTTFTFSITRHGWGNLLHWVYAPEADQGVQAVTIFRESIGTSAGTSNVIAGSVSRGSQVLVPGEVTLASGSFGTGGTGVNLDYYVEMARVPIDTHTTSDSVRFFGKAKFTFTDTPAPGATVTWTISYQLWRSLRGSPGGIDITLYVPAGVVSRTFTQTLPPDFRLLDGIIISSGTANSGKGAFTVNSSSSIVTFFVDRPVIGQWDYVLLGHIVLTVSDGATDSSGQYAFKARQVNTQVFGRSS